MNVEKQITTTIKSCIIFFFHREKTNKNFYYEKKKKIKKFELFSIFSLNAIIKFDLSKINKVNFTQRLHSISKKKNEFENKQLKFSIDKKFQNYKRSLITIDNFDVMK